MPFALFFFPDSALSVMSPAGAAPAARQAGGSVKLIGPCHRIDGPRAKAKSATVLSAILWVSEVGA